MDDKQMHGLEDHANVILPSQLDSYLNRPPATPSQDMCLADYTCWYEVSRSTAAASDDVLPMKQTGGVMQQQMQMGRMMQIVQMRVQRQTVTAMFHNRSDYQAESRNDASVAKLLS
jgi:hypothetical protein